MKFVVASCWLQRDVDIEAAEIRKQQQGVDDEEKAHQPFTKSALYMHSVALSKTHPAAAHSDGPSRFQ